MYRERYNGKNLKKCQDQLTLSPQERAEKR